jgi:hypothetical protein
MKKSTNAVIQYIDTLHSATCFGTLNLQGVNYVPVERGVQCCRNQRRMEAVYCRRWRYDQDILTITPLATIYRIS